MVRECGLQHASFVTRGRSRWRRARYVHWSWCRYVHDLFLRVSWSKRVGDPYSRIACDAEKVHPRDVDQLPVSAFGHWRAHRFALIEFLCACAASPPLVVVQRQPSATDQTRHGACTGTDTGLCNLQVCAICRFAQSARRFKFSCMPRARERARARQRRVALVVTVVACMSCVYRWEHLCDVQQGRSTI